MEFPELLKAVTSEIYAAQDSTKNLPEEERKRKFSRHVRITTKYLDNLRKEAKSGEIVWYSDAGKPVGGKGEHPGALQHFIAGLPLCQMTHYAERASVSGLRLDSLEMSVLGHYTSISGYGFDEIEYEARITSQETPETIERLAKAASDDCYVTNTLKRACRVKGHVFLNGKPLLEL